MSGTAEQIIANQPADKTVVEDGGAKQLENHAATLSDHAHALFQKMKHPRACVRDHDGYIACGPIVGYERPGEEGGMSGAIGSVNKALKDKSKLYKDK